jgi:hypothetical protein
MVATTSGEVSGWDALEEMSKSCANNAIKVGAAYGSATAATFGYEVFQDFVGSASNYYLKTPMNPDPYKHSKAWIFAAQSGLKNLKTYIIGGFACALAGPIE